LLTLKLSQKTTNKLRDLVKAKKRRDVMMEVSLKTLVLTSNFQLSVLVLLKKKKDVETLFSTQKLGILS
jgi:hypothetical protein